MSALLDFREEKDRFYKLDQNSPLSEKQKKSFKGLKYFPENPDLRMEIEVEMIDPPIHVILPTSTGDNKDYLHNGLIRFKVGDQEAVLQVYADGFGGYFLPFVDATAPKETYGAGRYLEPDEIRPGVLLVDFNMAFNPYCAYNERWSCPLPPAENRLKICIEAGEKKFK